MTKNIIDNFDEKHLPSLSEVTIAALELFINEGIPKLDLDVFKKPLVVGSGNAITTAKIITSDKEALYANESNFEQELNKNVDGVIIFSASGGKHAPIIANTSKKKGKSIFGVTCKKESPLYKICGENNIIVTPKNREPYTYNTSTYLGWILSKTREDPKEILKYLDEIISKLNFPDFSKYTGFLLVTPNSFSLENDLFNVKFIELFGRKIARDVKTYEEMKHAITVVPSETELAIQFGEGTFDCSCDIFKVPLPEKTRHGMMMSIGYYIIGKIQENLPQYFKNNIKDYIRRNSDGNFGKVMSVIVE